MINMLLVAVAVVLMIPASVHAHVLIKDQQTGTGAVLHVNPDDDPVAGEPASLFFDIRDGSINTTSQTRLTITDEQEKVAVVPVELAGSSVAAKYVFPRQGAYRIQLIISQNGKPAHTFLHTQRVSRGIIGVGPAARPPIWAEIGLVGTILVAGIVAIATFNRRQDINTYSKL